MRGVGGHPQKISITRTHYLKLKVVLEHLRVVEDDDIGDVDEGHGFQLLAT